MPLPSYQTVPLPSFGALPSAMGHSAEFERVLTLLHDVDERVAELYPQLTDHWLQSELYAFLHVKDELVSRVKKRATRKHSVAAGVAERRKELRVSTSAVTAAATPSAAAASLTSPDSGATEIARGTVPQTPANETMAATPARHNKSLAKSKSSVSSKQRVSAVLKELAGEEADDTPTATDPYPTASTTAAVNDKDEEAKEAEVISPLPHVNARTGSSTTAAKAGRIAAVASSANSKQRTDAKRLIANHSSSSSTGSPSPPSAIPVFTASAAAINRKKAAIPAFVRKAGRAGKEGGEVAVPGQTARVLHEEHAELAMKLDELQTRQKQLADKQDKYIKKREREDEEKRKREQEAEAAAAAAAALAAMTDTEAHTAAPNATVEAEADSGEALRPPPSPGRLAPLPADGTTSPRSPRHTPTSSMSTTLSPLSSARPLRPHSPSLPPLPAAASASLSPLTTRVAAAPLSARDQIVQPTTYSNDEAQRGTVCSGLLLCAPTPRLLLRPSTQEMEERHREQSEQAVQSVEQPTEAVLEPVTDEQPLEQQSAVSEAEQDSAAEHGPSEEAADSVEPSESEVRVQSKTLRPAALSVDKDTAAGLQNTSTPLSASHKQPPGSSLSATSSSNSSRSTSPLAGTASPRVLRPSTAEMSNAVAVAASPATPSARSRMVHRAGQPIGLAAVPTSPVGLTAASASARSRAASGETGRAVYEESFPTIGSRRSSLQRDEAAVVAEAVKGLGNLVENNKIEAAVEAAEARIKKERWTAVMRDIEKRKRTANGNMDDETDDDDELVRQRRKWRDESLITANDLRKQIALMGIRIDEADERNVPANGAASNRSSIPSTIDPLTVPLPPSARVPNSSNTSALPSARDEAVPLLREDNGVTVHAESIQSAAVEGSVSVLPVVDPLLVPLPLSSRTARTARTDRSARSIGEPVSSATSELPLEQPLSSGRGAADVEGVAVPADVEQYTEAEQQAQIDEGEAQQQSPQDGSEESAPVMQTADSLADSAEPQVEVSTEPTQAVAETDSAVPAADGSSE